MVHGAPDWGVFQAMSTLYGVHDMGELAARLGSIVTYDRRGNVAWLDDFEDNINKWAQSTSGNGAAAALSTDKARSGAKSAKLTTGDVIGNATKLTGAIGLSVVANKIGFELSFISHADVRIKLHLIMVNGGVVIQAGMRYDPAGTAIQYYDSAAAWIDLVTDVTLVTSTVWHTMKIVLDTSDDGAYVRALINNRAPNIAGIAPYKAVLPLHNQLYFTVTAEALAAANNSIYVDDAIITQNEP